MNWKKMPQLWLIGFALLLSFHIGTIETANAQSKEELTENFQTPSADNKPLTRWWVPGTQLTKEEIKKEIESMAKAGYGGAEVVPVSTEGGDGEGSINWGDDAWKDLTSYMLKIAGENNFTIDFTMTPAWPLALPTVTDINDPSQGAQMELDGAHTDGITKKKPFKGELPTSKEVKEDLKGTNIKPTLAAVTVAKYSDKKKKILDFDSVETLDLSKDITQTDKGYTASFTPKDDGEYVLFAWYQHPSANTKYGNNQIDHFSKSGTQQIIDYWKNNLLPAYGEDTENIRSLFIDSLEFETHLDWTYGVLEGFQAKKNYNLAAYLPALYDTDAVGNYMGEPEPDFTFNKNTEAVKNDFKSYMTELYITNHIQPLKDFAQKYGLSLRYQTSYGKNLETAQTALYPDIPETETLYGSDFLDFYRLQAGAVHITDKTIYSIESAAEWTEQWNDKNSKTGEYNTRGNGLKNSGNYEQTFQNHIWHDQRAFAAGVNQVVFHGYAYNGQYDGDGSENGYNKDVQWPGFDGFGPSSWSNSWGERQPNWIYAGTYLDFITRNQYVLRQGQAKVDLAIYDHSYYETIDFIGSKKIFNSKKLEQNGYSYDFLSPSAFELDNMTVSNKRLDASGASYKALILNNQKELTKAAAEKILAYARDGLPIIIIGEKANRSAYYKDGSVKKLMADLQKEKSIISVDKIGDLVSSLKENDIIADASYSAKLLANHRSEDNIEYYYLYNYGDNDSFRNVAETKRLQTKVTLQGQGRPYLLNAWTGQITPIAEYSKKESSVTVSVDIAANDSIIIALLKDETANPISSKNVEEVAYNSSNQLIVKGSKSGEVTIDGQTQTVELEKAEKSQNLTKWDLTVESWTKGETPSESALTTINVGELDKLQSWDKIKKLKNVSGVGTYKTTVTLNKGWAEHQGAVLEYGHIRDAFEIKVNGQTVQTSQTETQVDVGPYLKSGENTIEITVATSLLNAVLKENTDDLRDKASYGLTEAITLSPYSYQVIAE
ncbi:glycosyl hydrolase [Streptococcus sp. H31]|uniref:glycosyl hydrolase n=1 Tax=Streptococcus huangxiaojuni TaxID=3237239 RepID=UPI0034A34F28